MNIPNLISYITRELEARAVLAELQHLIDSRSSSAGVRNEEVFTREFLCPTISRYFYDEKRDSFNLTDHEIEQGLGTEGFQNCPGFGFTPASKARQLFTKSDIIQSTPPKSWFANSDKNISAFQACPDFAIGAPLPFSVVGEVKYVSGGSASSAVKGLYDAARQAMFYLGVYQNVYDAALLVVADGSPNHSFCAGLELIKPELLERFGEETGLYLATIKLH